MLGAPRRLPLLEERPDEATLVRNMNSLLEVSKALGEPMKGLEISKIGKENLLQYRGN